MGRQQAWNLVPFWKSSGHNVDYSAHFQWFLLGSLVQYPTATRRSYEPCFRHDGMGHGSPGAQLATVNVESLHKRDFRLVCDGVGHSSNGEWGQGELGGIVTEGVGLE